MSLLVEYVRRFGLFQRNARLYLINNVLTGVTTGMLLLLYNLYLSSLHYRADFIGLVLLVGTLGAGIAIFPAGILIDRFSGKAILIYSTVLIAIAGACQILFRQPIPLLLSAFCAGVAASFSLVINAPFLTNNSTPMERPHLFSLNLSLILITAVIGKLLGGFMPVWLRSQPWLMFSLPTRFSFLLASDPVARAYELSLLFAGIIAAPGFIPLFLMEDDRHLRPLGEQNTVSISLRARLRSLSVGMQTWIRQKGLLARLSSPIVLIAIVMGLRGLGEGFFLPYFNLYFVNHLGVSTALFGLIDSATTCIAAVLTLGAPWLAERIGKLPTIIFTQLVSIPMLVTLGFVGFVPLVIVFYTLRYGSMNMADGLLDVFSMEAVPDRQRGLANSSYQAVFQVASAISTPLGGVMIVALGYMPIFLSGAVCYLLGVILLWSWFGHRRTRQTEPDRTQLPDVVQGNPEGAHPLI
jgi:MFS family permease